MFLFIVGVFTWRLDILFFILLASPLFYLIFIEVILNKDVSNFYNCESRPVSFWLFLVTEAIAFASLFTVYLWFFEGESPISSPSGYSFVGSVFLLFSSIWVTAWHHEVSSDLTLVLPGEVVSDCLVYDNLVYSNCNLGLDTLLSFYPSSTGFNTYRPHARFLFVTILFGLFFIILQLKEFSSCNVNLVNSSCYSSFFCVVGLHFLHVTLGLSGLSLFPLTLGSSGVNYYCGIVVWYWHFVDYIWLWVYALFYLM